VVTSVTETVLVIGAGPAGLATAVELRRLGVRAEILERGDAVASSWRQRYDRLRLNTCKWNSTMSGEPFPKGTPVFPARDEFVRYLESYAQRHELTIRFGAQVDRIEPCDDGWRLSTSLGERTARHVVIAMGHENAPWLPDWDGLDSYPGRLLHSAEYRNAEKFRDDDVLVVGSGCSAMDIAYDLATGGAGRVRVAVRSQPDIWLRAPAGLPSDLLSLALFRLPIRTADRVARFIRRVTIGDLSRWGLKPPEEATFTRIARTGTGPTPTLVNRSVVKAIRAGRIQIVGAVAALDAGGVRLADGTTLSPDAIIAATGYTAGLDQLVGRLGVLDQRGRPLTHGGPPAAPGLRFAGYVPNLNNIYHEARRVAEQISGELASAK
jgi:cation diffusion facilitator CzcD-associated flavoprotein CzcO